MKIGHPANKPHPAPAATTSPVAAEPVKAPPGVAKKGTDLPPVETSATVALSSTASTLLSSGATSEFDAEKVGRIGDAIAAGSFKINPEAIADKLIANAQELLAKVKS